ncbi:MAG: hypothetical protein R6W70_03280 [bacterium]
MTDIERVIVDSRYPDYSLPFIVAEKCGVPCETKTKESVVADFSDLSPGEKFSRAGKTLFFTENRGRFLKKCPGSRGVVCCNYYTINSVTGCPFDCSYCILQHYIANNPFINIFLNREVVFSEMKEFLEKHRRLRVGTGELADSLALDNLIDESGFFLKGISSHNMAKNVQFELKTKSCRVEGLIIAHEKFPDVNTVAGFSVNIPKFTENEELHTASMDKRIEAMNKVMEKGIPVALHFDPVVMIPEFFNSYKLLVRNIFQSLRKKNIAWISMGGFRHAIAMKDVIRKRFPASSLLKGEMFPGKDDGKMRYPAAVRRRFYGMMKKEINRHMENPPLYMCMEKSFIWKDIEMNPRDISGGLF